MTQRAGSKIPKTAITTLERQFFVSSGLDKHPITIEVRFRNVLTLRQL